MLSICYQTERLLFGAEGFSLIPKRFNILASKKNCELLLIAESARIAPIFEMYYVKGGFCHLQRNDWRLICGRMATGGKERCGQRVEERTAPVKAEMNGLTPVLDLRRPSCR